MAELALGVIFYLFAIMGLTAAYFGTPEGGFLLVPPDGVGVPQQEADPDVLDVLRDWEVASRNVLIVEFKANQSSRDRLNHKVTLSRLTFQSADEDHWWLLSEPHPVDRSLLIQNTEHQVEEGHLQEWSYDGEELISHAFDEDAQRILSKKDLPDAATVNIFAKAVIAEFESGTFFRALFADFSSERFLSRYNVSLGTVTEFEDKSVDHLIFEPHEVGAENRFLRHLGRFEVLLEKETHIPMALRTGTPDASYSVTILKKIATK